MKNFIIYRYLCREITYPLFLVLLVLTFVLLMGRILQLMDLMINKGVDVTVIGRLILFLIPSFLTITIPIALIIAVLIGLGRLSRENEIMVMKSSGISLYQLSPPIAVLAVVSFAATLLLQCYFAPMVNSTGRRLLADIGRKQVGVGLKEQVFNDDFPGLVLFANQISVDGRSMREVFISDSRMGPSPITIVAKRGQWFSSPGSNKVLLRLEEGSTHTVGEDRDTYRKMAFVTYDITIDLSSSISDATATRMKEHSEMTPRELLQAFRAGADLADKERNLLLLELNKRFALPVTCLVFALLALPLGMVKHRTAKSRAFVVALCVVIVYYALQLGGDALGETGKVNPVIAAWAPNLVLGVSGLWLFVRTAREKPLLEMDELTASAKTIVRRAADRFQKIKRKHEG